MSLVLYFSCLFRAVLPMEIFYSYLLMDALRG